MQSVSNFFTALRSRLFGGTTQEEQQQHPTCTPVIQIGTKLDKSEWELGLEDGIRYRDLQTFPVVQQLTQENYMLREEADYWRLKGQIQEPVLPVSQNHHTSRSGKLLRRRKKTARSGKSMLSDTVSVKLSNAIANNLGPFKQDIDGYDRIDYMYNIPEHDMQWNELCPYPCQRLNPNSMPANIRQCSEHELLLCPRQTILCPRSRHAVLVRSQFVFRLDDSNIGGSWHMEDDMAGLVGRAVELFYQEEEGARYYIGTYKCIEIPGALSMQESRLLDPSMRLRIRQRAFPDPAITHQQKRLSNMVANLCFNGAVVIRCIGLQFIGFNTALHNALMEQPVDTSAVPADGSSVSPTLNMDTARSRKRKRSYEAVDGLASKKANYVKHESNI